MSGLLPDRVDVPESRAKLAVLVGGAVLLVLAGLLVALLAPLPVSVAGWAGVAFFGLALGWLLVRLVAPRAAVSVDRDGFTDRSSAVAGGRISWSEVRRIEPVNVMGQYFVGVHLHDPDAVLGRLNPVARRLSRVNGAISGAPVNINPNGIRMDPHELADLMERYRRGG